jgi:hypothetical protein
MARNWEAVSAVAKEAASKRKGELREAQSRAQASRRRHVQQGHKYQINTEAGAKTLNYYFGGDRKQRPVEEFAARYNAAGAARMERDGYERNDTKTRKYFETLSREISNNTPEMGDLRKLQEGDLDNIRRWNRMLPTLVGLYESGDKDSRKTAGTLMSAYFNQMEPHLNAMDPEWTKRFREKGRHEFAPKTGGPLGVGFAIMDRIFGDPQQGIMHGISAIEENPGSLDAWKYAGSSAARGLASGVSFLGTFGTDAGTRLASLVPGVDIDPDVRWSDRRYQRGGQEIDVVGNLDKDRSGHISLREAAGRPDWQGPGARIPVINRRLDVGGLLDFGGEIVLDPMTYLTAGSGVMAKQGLRASMRRVATHGFEGMEQSAARKAVEEAVRTVRWRGGWKALNDTQKHMLEKLIRDEAMDAAQHASNRMLRTQKARNAINVKIRRHAAKTQQLHEQWAERIAKEQLQRIQRRGQVGIGIAGRQVLSVPYSEMLESMRIIGRWDSKTWKRAIPAVTEGLANKSVQDVPKNMGYADDWVLGYDVSDPVNSRIKNAEKAYAEIADEPQLLMHAYIQTTLKGGNPWEYLKPLIEYADSIDGHAGAKLMAQLDAVADEMESGLFSYIAKGDLMPTKEVVNALKTLRTQDPRALERLYALIHSDDEFLPRLLASAAAYSKGSKYEEIVDRLLKTFPKGDQTMSLADDAYDLINEANFHHRLVGASRETFKGRTKEQIARRMTTAPDQHQQALSRQQFKPASPRVSMASDIKTKKTFSGRFARTSPRMIQRMRAKDEILKDPVRTSTTRSPSRFRNRKLDSALNKVIPRRRIEKGRLGSVVAEGLDTITTLARAGRDKGLNDNIRRALGRLAKRAAKAGENLDVQQIVRNLRRPDGKMVKGGIARRLRDAKTGGERVKAIENYLLARNVDDMDALTLREAVQAAGGKDILAATDMMRAIREEVTDISRRAGVPEESLRANYLPRVKNADALKRIEERLAENMGDASTKVEEVMRTLGLTWDNDAKRLTHTGLSGSLTHEGRLEARKWMPEIEDLLELNEAAYKELKKIGLEIRDLFIDDPHTAMLLRANTAYKAQMLVDVALWASKTMDNSGSPLAFIVRTPEDAMRMRILRSADDAGQARARYKEVQYAGGAKLYMHPDLADEVSQSWRMLTDPAIEGKILKFMDEWNNIWAGYATVGSVTTLGIGFHARNEMGNILNMILAGMTNPRFLRDAADLQRKAGQVHKIMEDTGLSFDEAAKQVKLTAWELNTINEIRKRGLFTGGRVADLFAGNKAFDDNARTIEAARKAGYSDTKESVPRRALNVVSDNPVLRGSRALGTRLEENAKVALYLDGISKGMSPQSATARVHKYLFDYNDLTSFEAKLRRVSRFYTFTRKNGQLFAGTLLTDPKRVIISTRIGDRWAELFTGDRLTVEEPGIQDDGRIIPDWATDSHRYSRRMGALLDVDTPFMNFADTYNSIWGLAGSLPFMTDGLMPEHQRQFDAAERMRNFSGLFSGGPYSALMWATELQTGVDSFNGFKLKNDAWSRWANALDIIAPITDRTRKGWGGWIDVAQAGWTKDPEFERILTLRVMNSFAGIHVIDLTSPDRAQRALEGIMREVEQTMYEAKDALIEKHGEEVWESLSMDNLREAGKIAQRNHVAEIMLLHPVEEWEERIYNLIPKETARRMGLPIPEDMTEKETRERDDKWHRNRVEHILSVTEAYNKLVGLPPLTAEERENIILLNAGITIPGLEGNNIEPWRENQFTKEQQGRTSVEEQVENARRRLIALGLNPDRMARERPLLSWAERTIRDARAAGWSEQQLTEYLVDDLSRQQRAVLQDMGIPVDNDEFSYRRLTQEQIAKREKESANINAKLDYIFLAFLGRSPSEDERFTYHYQTFLTKGEQRMLGLSEGPKVPSRRNQATDTEKLQDARAKAELARGQRPSGTFPTEDERKAWERRLNDREYG